MGRHVRRRTPSPDGAGSPTLNSSADASPPPRSRSRRGAGQGQGQGRGGVSMSHVMSRWISPHPTSPRHLGVRRLPSGVLRPLHHPVQRPPAAVTRRRHFFSTTRYRARNPLVTRFHGPRGNAVWDALRPQRSEARRRGASETAFPRRTVETSYGSAGEPSVIGHWPSAIGHQSSRRGSPRRGEPDSRAFAADPSRVLEPFGGATYHAGDHRIATCRRPLAKEGPAMRWRSPIVWLGRFRARPARRGPARSGPGRDLVTRRKRKVRTRPEQRGSD
jgi:hypothetical protein